MKDTGMRARRAPKSYLYGSVAHDRERSLREQRVGHSLTFVSSVLGNLFGVRGKRALSRGLPAVSSARV